MSIADLDNWKILAIISLIGLLLFWRKKSAIWGGLTMGLFIGLIVAIIYLIKGGGFDWKIIGKGIIVGTLCGIFVQILGMISDKLKRI